MIGYVFYFIYFALSFYVLVPFICKGKYIHLSMLPLLFFPHFNTTCFLKLGLTFSFFEIYLFVFSFLILLTGFSLKNVFRLNISGKIFGLFLIISILSILIAQFRIELGDLKPSTFYKESPVVRSFMSLNRLFVYPVLLSYIRSFYIRKNVDIPFYFKKYLAYSGIIPSIAVILQACGIECLLLFNNPSFSEGVEWKSPGRPFGLSYEASFYAFMCLFSFVGVYYAVRDNVISAFKGYVLYVLYAVGVLLCISRTGMLVFICFICLKNCSKLNFKRVVFVLLIIGLLSQINWMGFNMMDRLVSSFDFEADRSTVERWGSAEGLLNLAIHKSLFLGVGIYNYFYYVMPYIPSEMYHLMNYSNSDKVVSFNFILQLWAEWGGILFLFFFSFVFYKLYRIRKDGVMTDWFLYFFIISLSVQLMNFSLPFLILLYHSNYNASSLEENFKLRN
ncbi:hypothetical protein FNW54_03280 [Bacteroides sp. HF-5092]|uniref:O-antigen ligase family protein n=1 Tax=Bacteroides TaxID=816 RepID=UPI001178AF40|nr:MULTISPECIES: O-antigen ligase family protein [Bacteroides]TRX46502.1 hypothetical protein FNW54_03280 [Bacteroides sp. HF-5092]